MNAVHTTMATTLIDHSGGLNPVLPPAPPPKVQGSNEQTDGQLISSSFGSQSPIPSPIEAARKYTQLADLIESEKAYVDLLTGIIRNVAAAWSRSNLPPPRLDLMFRSVEGVYKTNRSFLAKLKEIGENPSSPKALGDLLMRWIDELEQPYMTYADRYCIGFDDWDSVKSNPKLPTILQAFSESNPPPSTLPEPTHLPNPSLWTLDALFSLPKGRLQYYRKLYSRLLKSMISGRSDHRLLTGALAKLDGLLTTVGERSNTVVGTPLQPQILLTSRVTHEVKSNIAAPVAPSANEPVESGVALLSGRFGTDPGSTPPSMRGSFSSREERLSQGTTATSVSRESTQALLMPVQELERRLATEHTLDIFTMQPKQIRLQIAAPNLPYARELRLSAKVLIRFTPRSTGVEVIHRHGHLYILSDLFLLCEELEPEERVAGGESAQDLRLCYPPLSGKVLTVAGVPEQENALRISIMRKETLTVEASSRLERDQIVNEFQECISFAKTISRAAQEPVPPLPPIGSLPQLPASHLKTSGSFSRERPERAFNPRLATDLQPEPTGNASSKFAKVLSASPPTQEDGPTSISVLQTSQEQHDVVLTSPEMNQDPRHEHEAVGSPLSSPASPGVVKRLPVLYSPPTGSMHLPRRSSVITGPPSSFVPGQIVPPMRSPSAQSHLPPSAMMISNLPGGPNGVSPEFAQSPMPQNSALRHHTSMHSLRHQPLQHQPSMQFLPHRPNHANFAPTPYPQPGPQPFSSLPSSPAALAHPSDQPQASHKLQKSPSSRSLHVHYQRNQASLPPVPSLPDGLPMPNRPYGQSRDAMGPSNMPTSRPMLPSMMGSRTNSIAEPSILDPSPPSSPVQERKPLGPMRSVIAAQMKCKVFHQQHHAQWKSLGSAHLTLYRQEPTNVKQLVVETGSKDKSILISTIVLTDGVERVGKTGVAIELTDAGGARTGVIYMIQLRNEDYASGLYKNLLAGSDRAV